MQINIYKDKLLGAHLFGASVLYSTKPIPREDVPQSWYCYDLRGTARHPDEPHALVDKAEENHFGSILSYLPLKNRRSQFRLVKNMFQMTGTSPTLAEFCAEEKIRCPETPIRHLLRPASPEDAGLLYEFFKSQGTVVINEAADFAGTNGCYLYQGRDVQERKNKHLKDQILVVAPSEGLVSADVWLRCRKKLMANTTFQNGRKAKNTWLAGKVKCGRCGYALMSVGNPSGVQYLRCSKRADNKSCPGCGTLRTREFERFIYGEMVKKLAQFQTLTGKREKVNPKLTALNVELARVEDEIEKLLNTLTEASAVLISYANTKIEELDAQRQTLSKEIAALSAETMSPEQIERLSVYLNRWEEIDFDDRRQVADGLISQIRATGECVAIEWKI
nr:LPD28 domain-containing protein [Flintibacter muris]